MDLELDEIDQKIIGHLKENSRTTFVDIGKKLDISDATVYNRVKNLHETGIIKKFTIEINEEALGGSVQGFMLITVHPGTVREVSEQLCKIKKVSEVHEIHGTEDLLLKVRADSLGKLRRIILKVRKISNVIQTEFIPIFKTWKG